MSFADHDPSLSPFPPQPEWPYWIRLWFGVSEPVSQRPYIASGFGLMALKYGVESLVIWLCTSTFFSPVDFLNPTMGARRAILEPGREWLPWALFLWTMPFLWIAVSMSVRRAADAGRSPWLGLTVLIPVVNLIVMLALCLLPSQPRATLVTESESATEPTPIEREDDRVKSAALAVGLSVLIGGLMLWVSVYAFSTYGASLFLGTPMLMGTTASYLYNRQQPRTGGSSIWVGVASVTFAMFALLLFALEGALCVAMAAPLVLPIGAMGGLIGKAIAEATRRPTELLAAVLVLPLWAGVESLLADSKEYVVFTAVEIDAPPAAVWKNVVGFPELTAPKPWYFAWGIACPERARIVGQGVGAVRHCEFTTGTFVEPITVWDEPKRLAFDVTEQPDPLWELSPYRDVRPPHLNHSLRSTHGEFRLISLPEGRTRLEGRTWYQFDMYPQWFWTAWSDEFIHRIHQRVLLHIKELSEGEAAAPTLGVAP